jgi:hypothetical protein
MGDIWELRKYVTKFAKETLGPQEPSFQVATRVGPFGDAFVLPDQVVSVSGKEVYVALDDNLRDYLSWGRTGGTLEGWQELQKLAEGNSRLIVALGLAFVGPLRLVTPVEPFCVQVTGAPGKGKSTLAACGSSTWGQRLLGGKPHDLCGGDTWDNTVNNLERVLATRDHTFLPLNEAHHIEPKDQVKAVFKICEDQGKGRSNEVSRWEWFAPVFSTSNMSVVEIGREAKKRLDRALFDRLIDIHMPGVGFGFFENLHGSAAVKDFCVRLKAIYDVNFGIVGRAYVLGILKQVLEDREGLAKWINDRRDYFTKVARKQVSSHPDHERVIGHFATIYAALRLAKQYKFFVLQKGRAREALLTCLRDHLSVTDGLIAKTVIQSPLDKLKAWVAGNKSSFVDLSKPLPEDHNHDTCLGYIYSEAGRSWYGLRASAVEIVVGGKAPLTDPKQLLNEMDKIKKNGGGKDGARYSTKVKIGSQRLPLYSIDCSALE